MNLSALYRRFGRARPSQQASWLTAIVRTLAFDKAADAAFRKAKKEKNALERSWSNKMTIAVGYMRSGKADEQKMMEEGAAKDAAAADEQVKIIEAALKYAKLPKEGA
jgi:hypothetical protein